MLSIKYRAAEKVAQTIPDEYMDGRPKEVNNRDIMARVREMRIPFKARTSPIWPPPTFTRKESKSGGNNLY